MGISIISHTENSSHLVDLFRHLSKNYDKSDCELFLHSKNYQPWENKEIEKQIRNFKKYFAFQTQKSSVLSTLELIYKSKTNILYIFDESNPYNFLKIKKQDLLRLSLDTKYKTLKWFILDIKYQLNYITDYSDDGSEDYNRFKRKIESVFFGKRIIYIDGGMGDHIMSLPLIEKLSPNIFISCKYPFVFDHVEKLGLIDWNDELFGGYSRFAYEYGSINNSEYIVDVFFEMYGEKRESDDLYTYKGNITKPDGFYENQKIALICTSAARINNKDSNKDWKDIRWFKLVHELNKMGYLVIQVGSKKDSQIPNISFPRYLDKSLSELAGLIEYSSLWITVDTFFHHFAAAIKPEVGICLTPFHNNHAKHPKVTYIEKNCGKDFSDRKWWLDSQQPERKECMDLIQIGDVLKTINK